MPLSEETVRENTPFIPPQIQTIEQTGLSMLWLEDLVLKVMYFSGYLSGFRIAELITLPFAGVVEVICDALKKEKLIEVRSSVFQSGIGEGSYQFGLTAAGIARAREALDRCQYAGPAPVPLQYYYDACLKQARGRVHVTQKVMHKVMGHLVLPEKTIHKLGPAINSGTSIFIFGPPGNGKTSVARALGDLYSYQEIFVPFALYVDGQIIKYFDSVNHVLVDGEDLNNRSPSSLNYDPRWVHIKRPFIMVGGELSLAGLDLVFDSTLKYYEAPFQLKANGGVLLVDDFGRQHIHPRDLLNRWIVPLENRIDFLSLHTGRKIELPFDVLVIFSTNLPPMDLVDEAFLRRLRHKIEIGDPSYEEYREIFKRVCASKNIPYDDQALAYLLQEWYIRKNRNLRSNQPRDLIDQVIDICNYFAIEPKLTPEIIDRAAEAYFVDL
ncbi:MAG: AAA family ATPase [Chloroflexi bacterium]|nr:AAA family ATPase [Chloroflexota bacterium]